MEIYILASGSKGNATLVSDGRISFIIDCGLSKTDLIKRLNKTPYKFEDISFALFTHEHSDHIKGAGAFKDIVRYAPSGVIEKGDYDRIVEINKPIKEGKFKITPIKTSHDTPHQSVAYKIENSGESLLYLTDTGAIFEEDWPKLENLNYYIIESNHDVKKLFKTNRPPELIARILSDYGHLSNEDSALYMSHFVGPDTKLIVLAHLSEEANSPELALSAYQRIFLKERIHFDLSKIICAKQWEVTIVKGYEN